MNAKQKRTAVHMYQLGVYKPQNKRVKYTEPLCYELVGVDYPYRKEEIDIKFFDVFQDENQTKKR